MEAVKRKENINKKVKSPIVVVLYNNKNITKNISKYLQSVTYIDYEKDQSDELTITINDFDGFFQNAWRPVKGDKISAKMGYEGETLLNCGTFTVDEPEIEMSMEGDIFIIRALAASVNQKIRQINSKSFVNKTLVEIAKKIAEPHGYTVAGSAGFIKIPYEIQYNETDLAFLKRISAGYGYIFKLTDNVITFIPAEKLENKKSILKITRKDIEHAVLRDCATKTYTACSVKYLNPKTGKLVTYTAKTNKKGLKTETLKLNTKYATKAQAKTAAEAGLRRGSKAVEGNIDFKRGQINAIAGVNIDADFKNSFSGVYHILHSTHTITRDDYKTSVEVEQVA